MIYAPPKRTAHPATDASIDFLQRNKNRPMGLYVAHETPHFPFQGPENKEKVPSDPHRFAWLNRLPDPIPEGLAARLE